jgi:hypothetical protein
MVNILIQRPRIRSEFTALKDCEPPLTWAIANVLPCVGRTLPVESGIQSIWFLKTPVCCRYSVSFSADSKLPGCCGRTYKSTMLLWAHPDVAITPLAELPELLDFWVVMLLVIFYRET